MGVTVPTPLYLPHCSKEAKPHGYTGKVVPTAEGSSQLPRTLSRTLT